MRKQFGLTLGIVSSIILGALAAPAPAAAETVRMEANIWVGFGPLWLAQEKGFFKKHGVDLQITVNENTQDKYAQFAAGKFDMVAGSAGTTVLYMSRPDQFQYIIGLDDSNGGDGVISKNEITSLADLKGKTIGLSQGSISEFYLIALLKQAGLKESDVKVQNMNADDAGKAFLDKKIDAAVTWEPWLSKAKATDFGHLLIDSSANPGLLSDVLVASSDYVTKHPNEVKAIVAGWNEAIEYLNAHQQDAIETMAKAMGGWLKDTKVFAETLEGCRFYGAEDNKAFFGTKAKPGPLAQTVKEAISAFSSDGRVKIKVTPEDLMSYSFVNG